MSEVKAIYSDRCWLEGKLQPATVYFENAVITAIFTEKKTGAEDVGNYILMPGIIDAHVHINEPGRTDWEGFDTATMAAAAGGITTIVDMPLNASPVTTNLKSLNEKLQAGKNKLHVNVGLYGGLIPGNKNEMEELIKAGVLGIKCFLVHSGIDEFPNVSEKDIDEAMPLIAKYHLPLLAHCEIYKEEAPSELAKYPQSYKAYLSSRPKYWENDAIEMMIRLCRKHHCATHIVHVSSAEALKFIAEAKEQGLPLTAETCPHYIYFHAEEIPDGNTLYKCAPPIREKENNDLLKEALDKGILDFLTTDHSPAPASFKEMKSGNLQNAWGGIAGLQFLLSSGWAALKENISPKKFIPLLTEHPAKFLNIDHQKGFIKIGFDADFVIWSPDENFIVNEHDIFHRHKTSPYNGKILSGVVKQTIVNGNTVYKNNVIINKNQGKWLLKK